MFHKKQIFKINFLKKLLTDENSCVSLVPTTRLLALPPFFLNDMKSGILYLLNAMLKKYDRSLGGIVIGYQNIKVLMDENTGIIPIGTSETEVNISVEFYIFQPKIGSCLEGIINKKSNNHIGCLVHRYFNATILKPEDIDYDDWICKDFSVDDKVIFRVKDLDFTTLLPYIEGIVDDENSVKKVQKTENSNIDNIITNNVNKSSENESLISKKLFDCESSKEKDLRSDFLNVKKTKNKNEEEVSLDEKPSSSSKEFNSFSSPKKKKKKKEKNVLNVDNCNKTEEKFSDGFSSESKSEESNISKKKKKKDKHDSDNQERLSLAENIAKEENSKYNFLERQIEVEDENSDHFVKESKSKKVKKKEKEKEKNRETLDFSKIRVSLPTEEVEDNVLYSTQLEQISEPKKMSIPFYSPIPPEFELKKKVNNKTMTTQNLDISAHLKNANDSHDKEKEEKKKKHKKRPREEKEESEGCSTPKKLKTSDTSKEKAAKIEVNGLGDKTQTQIMMEEMYKKLLNEAKERLNVPDKARSKVKKKKKKSKKEKKSMHNESLKVNKSTPKKTPTQVNGLEEKPTAQSILDKLLQDELKRLKEDLNFSDKEKIKTSKKSKADKQEKKVSKEKTKDGSSKEKQHRKSSVNGKEKIK